MSMMDTFSDHKFPTVSVKHVIYSIVVYLHTPVLCYDNLALRKPAWQSTTYDYKSYWPARLAVDGDTSVDIHNGSCAISNVKQNTATWRVDLGHIQSIQSIKIFYRNDEPEKYDIYSSGRFAGFFLYVSNTTNKDDGYLCYHDNSNSSNLPLPVLDITCYIHGRYVIYYNERRSDVIYPDYYSPDAFTELCEVQVFGCSTGHYGENCDKTCPPNCYEQKCNIKSGDCLECKAGYKNDRCTEECGPLEYGQDCSNRCSGHCMDNAPCDRVDGMCKMGCSAGYLPPYCSQSCSDGMYGNNCTQLCSKYCTPDRNRRTCHHVSGNCPYGCLPGWRSARCDEECPERTYGPRCSIVCGSCDNDDSCDHVNGTCPRGCKSGYQGERCDKPCIPGFYGESCRYTCGSYCEDRMRCNHVTGHCLCKSKWTGPECFNTTSDESDQVHIGTTIGLCMLGVFLVVIVSILFCIIQRKKWIKSGQCRIVNDEPEDTYTISDRYDTYEEQNNWNSKQVEQEIGQTMNSDVLID